MITTRLTDNGSIFFFWVMLCSEPSWLSDSWKWQRSIEVRAFTAQWFLEVTTIHWGRSLHGSVTSGSDNDLLRSEPSRLSDFWKWQRSTEVRAFTAQWLLEVTTIHWGQSLHGSVTPGSDNDLLRSEPSRLSDSGSNNDPLRSEPSRLSDFWKWQRSIEVRAFTAQWILEVTTIYWGQSLRGSVTSGSDNDPLRSEPSRLSDFCKWQRSTEVRAFTAQLLLEVTTIHWGRSLHGSVTSGSDNDPLRSEPSRLSDFWKWQRSTEVRAFTAQWLLEVTTIHWGQSHHGSVTSGSDNDPLRSEPSRLSDFWKWQRSTEFRVFTAQWPLEVTTIYWGQSLHGSVTSGSDNDPLRSEPSRLSDFWKWQRFSEVRAFTAQWLLEVTTILWGQSLYGSVTSGSGEIHISKVKA